MTQDDVSNPTISKSNAQVRELAVVAIALLRHDDKKLQHQAKHLVRTNPSLARDVFSADVDGWTPIHACAQRGSKILLKIMLSSGVDVNLKMGQPEDLPSGCSLLHIASDRRHVKMMDYLILHGADINTQDSFGRTPLFYANRTFYREAIKLLLDNGADLLSPEISDSKFDLVDSSMTPEPNLSKFCFLLHKS